MRTQSSVDREVVLLNEQGEHYLGKIKGFLLEDNNVRLDLVVLDQVIDYISVIDRDFFESLIQIRIILEKKGFYILCNGARKDVYPSGMTRDMFKGVTAYKIQLGVKVQVDDRVNIFDECSRDFIVTPQEQRDFYNHWLKSFGLSQAN